MNQNESIKKQKISVAKVLLYRCVTYRLSAYKWSHYKITSYSDSIVILFNSMQAHLSLYLILCNQCEWNSSICHDEYIYPLCTFYAAK